MSLLYMAVGMAMGLLAFVLSLYHGGSPALAIAHYSLFGSTATVMMAVAFLCADALEKRIRSGN